jgi:hypothetical protein
VLAEGLLRAYPSCRTCVKQFTCPMHIGATDCPYSFKYQKDTSVYPGCAWCRRKVDCENKRIPRRPVAALKLNPAELRRGTLTTTQIVIQR